MERGVIRPVIAALLLWVLALASIARAQQVAPGAASPGGASSAV
jgi:hypothetical protein